MLLLSLPMLLTGILWGAINHDQFEKVLKMSRHDLRAPTAAW